jgi:DNA-binding HxlR family transcriptional regulator
MAAKKHPYDQYSPDARALDVAGDKWTLLIVRDLLDGPMRFVALQRRLPGISTEQLRTRLNRMVADGILTRTRYREVPPRVDYELTEKGLRLLPVIAAWSAWGLEHCADRPGEDEADRDGSAALRLADALERGDRRKFGRVAQAIRWFANRGTRSEAVAA